MTQFIVRQSLRWKARVSLLCYVSRPKRHLCPLRFISATASLRDVIFPNIENATFHSILRGKPQCKDTLLPLRENETIEQISEEQFASLVASEFGDWAPEAVGEAFLRASAFAGVNGVFISDQRMQALRAALVGASGALPDRLLLDCVRALRLWPPAAHAREAAYADVWRALDKACAARVSQWPPKTLLLVSDHWAALHLAGFSRCVVAALKRLLRKPARLPPPHLLQALYYANAMRKPSSVADMLEVEIALEKCMDELSLDDFGIVAAAFFKGETQIRSDVLLSHMMRETMEAAAHARDVPLAALLKVVRYSAKLSLSQRLYALLGVLEHQVPRLSLLTCSHVALAGTNMQMLHEGVVRRVLTRMAEGASEVRLKELERLSLVVCLFNLPAKEGAFGPTPASQLLTVPSVRRNDAAPAVFVTQPPSLPALTPLEAAVERELRARVGGAEMATHRKCLPRALSFLSQRRVFPLDLIAKTLDPQELRQVYGKSAHSYQPELLTLDMAVELECPEYDGPRLSPNDRAVIAKYFRQPLPSTDERGSFADKFMFQVLVAARVAAGSENRVAAKHLLPQFNRGDLVLRLAMAGGGGGGGAGAEPRCLPLPDSFLLMAPTGEAWWPPVSPCERWVALIPAGWNCFIHGDGEGTHLAGPTMLRVRYLSLMGFTPVLVPWFEWIQRPKNHRAEYVWEVLSAAAAAPAGWYVMPKINTNVAVCDRITTASAHL